MASVNCKLCGHPDRVEIEELAASSGPRAAARIAGCSHNAVMRHMKAHASAKPDIHPDDIVVPEDPTPEMLGIAEPMKATEAESAAPPPTPQQPTPSAPIPDASRSTTIYVGDAGRTAYKARYPIVAAMTTAPERRRYLVNLFRLGRFHGLRTAGHLSLIWDDLGPIEFAELVSQAAIETNFRRGSEQARRVVLLGKVEQLYKMAVKVKDLRTAARLLETWAKLDVPVGVDLMTALASTAAWPLVARELQAKFPEAFEVVYGTLVAEEARKRQALAPASVESNHDG